MTQQIGIRNEDPQLKGERQNTFPRTKKSTIVEEKASEGAQEEVDGIFRYYSAAEPGLQASKHYRLYNKAKPP